MNVVDTQAAYIKFLEKYMERVKSGEVVIDQVILESNDHTELSVRDREKHSVTSCLTVISTNKV